MLYFSLSIVSYLLQNFSNKQFSNTLQRRSAGITLLQNGLCVLSAALVLLLLGGIKILSLRLMLLAAAFGGVYLLTVFLLLKAFGLGSMGNSTLLCNIGMFISAFYGIVRFGDAVSAYIILGAVLLLLAVLLCTPTDAAAKQGGYQWLLVAVSSGLANGVVASVKREAVAVDSTGAQNFLFWGFLFAAVFAFAVLFLFNDNRAEVKTIVTQPKLFVWGILAGIGTAGGNCFQMMALKTISSAIVYPLTSGILVVSLWCASCFIYKETTVKLKNVLAVAFCVLAIVLVNM